MIAPSKARDKKVFGGYEGEKNISIIGKGNAVIDLGYIPGSIGIVAGHNQNIKVQGITFKNMNSGHFIELDASENVEISSNRFLKSKPSEKLNAEAINIDTPDLLTKGFNNSWSNHDMTPNKNVTVKDNVFENVDRAVGTHAYSEGKLHTHIKIMGNVIKETRSDAIRVMNWKDSEISGNTISHVPLFALGRKTYGIIASGADNLSVKNNIFKNLNGPAMFVDYSNPNTSGVYKPIYNKISEKNIKDFETNKYENTQLDFPHIVRNFR